MVTTASKKRKRTYIKDPLEKINQGKPWVFHFEIEPEVAKKLIAEKEKAAGGAEFAALINDRLRKSYKLPKI